MLRIFVTGHHRGGTHTLAELKAKETGLFYVEERLIRWNSFKDVEMLIQGYLPAIEKEFIGTDGTYTRKVVFKQDSRLDNGFVLQCPGVAHKTLELVEFGKVYWCRRNTIQTITALKNMYFKNHAWEVMNMFHDEFPDDNIWAVLTYDGEDDFSYNFVQYYATLIKMKDYFYKTKFAPVCELVNMEDRQDYDITKTTAYKNPLKIQEAAKADIILQRWGSL